MRQVTYSFPAPDYNGIAATQSWTTSTGSYVVINGADYSQAIQGTTGQNTDRFAVLPGIQRTIGVFSTGNLSSVVFYASGLDTNGRVVTASFVGATGGSNHASNGVHCKNFIYSFCRRNKNLIENGFLFRPESHRHC